MLFCFIFYIEEWWVKEIFQNAIFLVVTAIFKGELSYLDKERFINLSRWFDNLQQMDDVRQDKKIINFKTNYLSYVAPARHWVVFDIIYISKVYCFSNPKLQMVEGKFF